MSAVNYNIMETWREDCMFVLLPSPPRSTPSWLGFVREQVSVDHKTNKMNASKKGKQLAAGDSPAGS